MDHILLEEAEAQFSFVKLTIMCYKQNVKDIGVLFPRAGIQHVVGNSFLNFLYNVDEARDIRFNKFRRIPKYAQL
ncbi:hypothetical protein C5167_037346 [Papaver somniferum]|uniref:Uncharacterized protein n=1 Tax=Papaver somniferum TaxID=3469 RepID=A0A4Y7IAE9_PAPSO|nr:hypothetical protein C5167_037346 [Papaver somniferum]